MGDSAKWVFSILAIALTFIGFVPYMVSIVRGKTRPHVFSWVIWGITTSIIFFAQLEADGGIGAWPIGVSGGITIIVALLAYLNRGDNSITRADWLFLLTALASLPLWYVTQDPTTAVVILTTVDMIGFGPTFRKAYYFPREENAVFFSMFAVRNFFALLALESYSLATMLFPLAVSVACTSLLILLLVRRQQLSLSQ
ncbi:hypothetical protein FJM67_01990 [Maribrevibacterium harenarium]|uniref:Uncharacterized protein n=1 Tax=Maribrevibacterium harenarium TaxID=2589817 RepID=A0A501X4G8_9GAMM|nr:hypothetical protein [Maribrevibacterium harenarium]TPE55338.1 hypothetical protein FJM67_01990 [Maribrevibacterium harenarium]